MGLVFTAAALTFVVGVGIGVFTLGPESSPTATPPVAAANRGPDSSVLGAAESPAVRRESPIAGVEPVTAPAFSSGAVLSRGPTLVAASGAAPASARPSSAGVGLVEEARGPAPETDPWEAAALAAEAEAVEERIADEETADDRARKEEPARGLVPHVAAAPPASEASTAAKRTATIRSDGVPVASLPVEEVSAAALAEVESAEAAAPIAESARPGLGDVSVNDTDDRFEVKVLKTVWHPRPERRSASLKFSADGEVLEVGEGDPVSGYLVEEITPSKVVLSKGGVTVSHRVGH